MKEIRPPRSGLESIAPYDVQKTDAEIDLSANENPRNLPGELLDRIRSRLSDVDFNRYPDPMATELRELVAQANGLEPANVLVGNGGDELLFDATLAWGGPGRTMLSCPPTFAMYEIDAQTTGTQLVSLPRNEDFSVDGDALISRLSEGDVDVVCLSNPNNPTGDLIPETLLISVLETTDALVLIDEAYFEFSRHTMRPHMSRHGNLVLLRTFSKAFSLAGLRVGYLLGREDVVRDIAKVRQPYSVDRFSQVAAALVFRERAVFESSIHETLRSRDLLVNGLSDLDGVTVFPSEANFVLFRVEHASLAWRDLLHSHSVLVRDLSRVPGLEDCLRVTAGTQEECAVFLEAMDRIMSARRASEILGVTAVASRHEEDEEKEGGG